MTEQEYADLDLAVARAEIAAGQLDIKLSDYGFPTIMVDAERWEPFRPSVNAAHAWTIIEEHWPAIVLSLHRQYGDGWANLMARDVPLLAGFMRAYLAIRQ
jgi:hypothetical protein